MGVRRPRAPARGALWVNRFELSITKLRAAKALCFAAFDAVDGVQSAR